MAAWAREPSAGPSEADLGEFERVLDEGVDTPRALAVLEQVVEHPGLASGVKYETLLAMDRFLGLQLTREVGSAER